MRLERCARRISHTAGTLQADVRRGRRRWCHRRASNREDRMRVLLHIRELFLDSPADCAVRAMRHDRMQATRLPPPVMWVRSDGARPLGAEIIRRPDALNTGQGRADRQLGRRRRCGQHRREDRQPQGHVRRRQGLVPARQPGSGNDLPVPDGHGRDRHCGMQWRRCDSPRRSVRLQGRRCGTRRPCRNRGNQRKVPGEQPLGRPSRGARNMVRRGNGCRRSGLQGIVRSRSEAVAGVAAATAAASRGRALATGPPALVRPRPGKGAFAALTGGNSLRLAS